MDTEAGCILSKATMYVGNVFDVLEQLPDNCVDLVLTSPPFLGLRSYLPEGHSDKRLEIGQDRTPADFIATLLDVVEACDRVLAPHGSIAFELGDTYSGSGGAGGDYSSGGLREGQQKFDGTAAKARRNGDGIEGPRPSRSGRRVHGTDPLRSHSDDLFAQKSYGRWRSADGDMGKGGWPADKSLCGIPHLFYLSLAYGRNLLRPERTTDCWRIRNVVAWCRPNPPVGALGDKFRPAVSYLTIATKSRTRYFDLDAVRDGRYQQRPGMGKVDSRDIARPEVGLSSGKPGKDNNPAGAPPLDYWEISTQPYSGAHYATWPTELLKRPIKSMVPERVCLECGEPSRRLTETSRIRLHDGAINPPRVPVTRDDASGSTGIGMRHGMGVISTTVGWSDCGHNFWRPGVVLDPFGGSGTTGAVALQHGRDAILIDLDERNVSLAHKRVAGYGLFEVIQRDGTVQKFEGQGVLV